MVLAKTQPELCYDYHHSVRANTENNYNNLDYQGDTLYFSVTNRGIKGLYRWADDDTAYFGDDCDGELFIVSTSLTYRFESSPEIDRRVP